MALIFIYLLKGIISPWNLNEFNAFSSISNETLWNAEKASKSFNLHGELYLCGD